MFQLQLQQNHLQNQPWKVVNYCLEPFTNSYLCYSKEVYLGNSIFKLFPNKLLLWISMW